MAEPPEEVEEVEPPGEVGFGVQASEVVADGSRPSGFLR